MVRPIKYRVSLKEAFWEQWRRPRRGTRVWMTGTTSFKRSSRHSKYVRCRSNSSHGFILTVSSALESWKHGKNSAICTSVPSYVNEATLTTTYWVRCSDICSLVVDVKSRPQGQIPCSALRRVIRKTNHQNWRNEIHWWWLRANWNQSSLYSAEVTVFAVRLHTRAGVPLRTEENPLLVALFYQRRRFGEFLQTWHVPSSTCMTKSLFI